MAQFIPRNQEEADAFNASLSATIFKSVRDFVDFYNSGLINRRNTDVVNILNQLTKIYRDVEEKNGSIVFLTKDEILLDEIMSIIEPWKTIVKVKRELAQAIDKKILSQDSVIAFVKGQSVIFYTTPGPEGNNEELAKLNSERIVKSDHEKIIFDMYSSLKERATADTYYFRVSDLLTLDSAFIENIYRALAV